MKTAPALHPLNAWERNASQMPAASSLPWSPPPVPEDLLPWCEKRPTSFNRFQSLDNAWGSAWFAV